MNEGEEAAPVAPPTGAAEALVKRRPVKMGLARQAIPKLPPPIQEALAAPPASKRLGEMIQTIRDHEEAAGLRPGDAMHALLESLVTLHTDTTMQLADHARRVEATTIACRHLMESGKAKAEADVVALSVQMVDGLRQGLEADWSKMALRLPRQIGALRATLVGVSSAIFLAVGVAGGVWWQRGQTQSFTATLHNTFAPGTKGADTWLRLHANNDIDAALAAGRCSNQSGRRACDVSLWMENAPLPARQ